MGKGEERELAPLGAGSYWSDRWVAGAFLLFVSSLGIAASFLLFREGEGWVLLIALAIGALLWVLEHWEIKFIPASTPSWNPLPGHLRPMVIISLVGLVACLPALQTYFLNDDFGYLHVFRNLSLNQFLQLFHADIAEVLWGEPRQELRPFYSVFYMIGFRLWGLHPLGYHLSGLLLHIIVSFLVFLVAKSFADGDSCRAGLAGLLYAVQPVHSQTISMIVGSVAEFLPTLLYLSAFLCFMRFRASGLMRYLMISMVAFAAALLSKEGAVTLPIMLVTYDLFRIVGGEDVNPSRDSPAKRKLWRRLILVYAPFGVLLLAYLELRRYVFTSFLHENSWGSNVHEAVSTPAGFWLHFSHLLTHVWDLQAFNLREFLFPFPALALGFILGLLGIWALTLFRRRSECRRSLAIVLYFGLVWYGISNLPLLAVMHAPYHLYLPAVGPCIATAFLAMPPFRTAARGVGYGRFSGMVFLVGISALGLWRENAAWARTGEMSETMAGQLITNLKEVPQDSLVVLWPAESHLIASGWGEMLPYAVETPFAPTDLYSRARIIEHPDMSCCPGAQWWEKTRRIVGAELAGPRDGPIEIYLLAWDERSKSFQQKTRVVSRGLFHSYVMKSLGGPLESTDSLEDAAAKAFVEALAKLVWQGV